MLAISIISCAPAQVTYGITREQYNWSYKFPKDDDVLEMADNIVDGHLWVLDTLEHLENLKAFDWNVQYTVAPNTFQLYL